MTAAPIWTEFMKKASALPQYADMKEFSQPTGVVDVQLDKATNRLATSTCPDDYKPPSWRARSRARLAISRPEWLDSSPASSAAPRSRCRLPNSANAQNQQNDPQKKKGFFGKIAGIFKDDKSPTPPPKPPDATQTAPH